MLMINEFQFENNIGILLKKIEEDINKDYNLNLLRIIYKGYNKNIDTIIAIINREFDKKQDLLNQLAVFFYKLEEYEDTLLLLNSAYMINPNNSDTLYNLGYFLYCMNETQLALEFLNKIEPKDANVIKLINEVQSKMQAMY